MSRILFWLAIGLGLWWFVRVWLKKRGGNFKQPQHQPSTSTHANASQLTQALLPCAHCGAHTAPELGLWHQGRFYCGHDHAQKGGKNVV